MGRSTPTGPGGSDAAPDHVGADGRVDQLRRVALVDVAEQTPVRAVADEAAQPRRELGHLLPGDGEQLALLLADPAGCVVAHDPGAGRVAAVRPAAVPQA